MNKKTIIGLCLLISLASACGTSKCKICEVLKNDEMLERYEGCDADSRKLAEDVCMGSAEMMDAECECRDR